MGKKEFYLIDYESLYVQKMQFLFTLFLTTLNFIS